MLFLLLEFSSVFGKTAPASFFWKAMVETPLQDTALDLHDELLLWYVCEDAEASGNFYWGFGVWVADCAEMSATIHGVFSSVLSASCR